jgi:hypothetical protein
MSYTARACCNGLGQTPAEVESAKGILIRMIQAESNRIAGLADTPPVAVIRQKIADATRWARAASWRLQDGKNAEAMESVVVGIRTMHEVSRAITGLSAQDRQAAQAQQRTQTGASFLDQVLVSLGVKTPEEVYHPDVAGGTVADVVGSAVGGTARALETAAGGIASYPWLIPAAAGVALFFATRK